jgi:hypothetical protein
MRPPHCWRRQLVGSTDSPYEVSCFGFPLKHPVARFPLLTQRGRVLHFQAVDR